MTASIALQYSNSLMKLTTTHAQIEEFLNDFQHLSQLLDQHPKLTLFLASPIFSDAAKKELLMKLFEKKINNNLLHFLFLLIDKKRMPFLKEISQEYSLLAKEKLKIEEVQIITAVPLENKVQEQLKKQLERFLQKRIEMQAQVAPEIIGGAIFIIGQKIIDHSIKNRLTKIKEDLLAVKLK